MSGVVDHIAENDRHALKIARSIIANLNQNKSFDLATEEPLDPAYPADELLGIVPEDTRKPFDIREVVARIVDASRFDEIQGKLWRYSSLWFRSITRIPYRDYCQQWYSVFRICTQGSSLCRTLLSEKNTSGLPAKYYRIHGWQEIRIKRYCQGWSKNGYRRVLCESSKIHCRNRGQFRCRAIMRCADVHLVLVFSGCGRMHEYRLWAVNRLPMFWHKYEWMQNSPEVNPGQKKSRKNLKNRFESSMKLRAIPTMRAQDYGTTASLIHAILDRYLVWEFPLRSMHQFRILGSESSGCEVHLVLNEY